MYFKLSFEDGTELYKDLDDVELQLVLNNAIMESLVREEIGEEIEDWFISPRPATYQDVVEIDISPAVIRENPPLIVDNKKVTKIDLLEGATYEHALATLALTEPNSAVYSKNVGYVTIVDYDEDRYEEDDGGYNDEPPDWD